MADHSDCFRQTTKPAFDKNVYIPPIRSTESNDSSCNLSASWIDVDTTTSENNDGHSDHQTSFESSENLHRGDLPVIVDDGYFGDSFRIPVDEQQQLKHQQKEFEQQEATSNQEEPFLAPRSEGHYIEIIDTHYETVEGYDWEGILDLRNRIKKQEEDQQQKEGITALQWVTEYRLYLTDGKLEEATEEASLALDNNPRYDVVVDKETRRTHDCNQSDSSEGVCKLNDDNDFVEFVESSRGADSSHPESASNISSQGDDTGGDVDEEFASLALSPLDVLNNSLIGTKAFHRNHHRHSVRLTELIVGGPSLQLGESSIEHLAEALTCGGSGALRRLVLIVSAVDLSAMNALGDCFRALSGSLEDFHFYASQTTERLVASRSRYKNVPAPCVLGPGISCWVDAWTSNPNNRLRSLNLSRMDIGDEAAFALSRLLLSAPRLDVLKLAQDDFYASSSLGVEDGHPPLSFAGTKRLLESLILIEDMKKRSRSSFSSDPIYCANLLELDLSGWILEDEERGEHTAGDEDDEKAIDDFYDDYNYIDGGSGQDEFDFSNDDSNGDGIARSNPKHGKNERACCVIASMLRVNTSLRKLILVAEDSCTDLASNELLRTGRRNRGLLSVRSTLAIGRALRDHVSTLRIGSNNGRPLGSNLRTLILSTDYSRGMNRNKTDDTSSWAVAERKRAVAKVFHEALAKRPIHQLRLQKMSCTMAFKGLAPLDGGAPGSSKGLVSEPSPHQDLRDQLDFYLQRNRSINNSLTNIDSYWLPQLSSLSTTPIPHTTKDDDEDEDCHFVEITDIDTDSKLISTREPQKNPTPISVLLLPALLAKADKEASRHDVVFSCAKILAQKTTLWEMYSEHRGVIGTRQKRI